MIKNDFLKSIENKSTVIGVIGLGYVGLPLVVEFAHKGFNGIGFEVDQKKADKINAGDSYIPDVPQAQVKELVEGGKLKATTDFSELKNCDAIFICVPTPLRKTKEPDISYILAASEQIQKYQRRGQLIVLESTTYPGTTDEVLQPILEEHGMKLDTDFLLAFSPERVDPGNPQFQTHNIPKVVGGCSDDSTETAAKLYGQIVNHVHTVSSARVAEAAKLLENTFRAVNIGMANEMARLCYTLNMDTWEVIGAAATKPFGFMAFYPGPGIGGHCLVGSETVVVKDDNVTCNPSLEELFVEQRRKHRSEYFKADDTEVVNHPALRALSIDMKNNLPVWRDVEYLFKRKYTGEFITFVTTDNRQLTVTSEHPLLVVQGNNLVERAAKDLRIGERVPFHLASAPTIDKSGSTEVCSSNLIFSTLVSGDSLAVSKSNHRSINIFSERLAHAKTEIASVGVKSIERFTDTRDVYSIEVEDTHTFTTSFGLYVHNCIPLDPHYLSWKARQHGFDSRFISLAEEVNSRMPEHVVRLTSDALNDDKKALNGAKILMLGVAYKKDVNDVRESPALAIIDLLRAKGADVTYHDSWIPEIDFEDAHVLGSGEPLHSIELADEAIKNSDCVIIVTDHTGVDYTRVGELANVIVDTRNAFKPEARKSAKARIVTL